MIEKFSVPEGIVMEDRTGVKRGIRLEDCQTRQDIVEYLQLCIALHVVGPAVNLKKPQIIICE